MRRKLKKIMAKIDKLGFSNNTMDKVTTEGWDIYNKAVELEDVEIRLKKLYKELEHLKQDKREIIEDIEISINKGGLFND